MKIKEDKGGMERCTGKRGRRRVDKRESGQRRSTEVSKKEKVRSKNMEAKKKYNRSRATEKMREEEEQDQR